MILFVASATTVQYILLGQLQVAPSTPALLVCWCKTSSSCGPPPSPLFLSSSPAFALILCGPHSVIWVVHCHWPFTRPASSLLILTHLSTRLCMCAHTAGLRYSVPDRSDDRRIFGEYNGIFIMTHTRTRSHTYLHITQHYLLYHVFINFTQLLALHYLPISSRLPLLPRLQSTCQLSIVQDGTIILGLPV